MRLTPSVIATVLGIVSGSVFAQTKVPGFELERLTLNPSGKGGLLVGSADLLDVKTLRASFTFHYEHDPLVFISLTKERLASVVGGRVTAHLIAAYGLTSWLEVGLQLPVVLWQGGSGVDGLGFSSVQTTALGTPWLQARASLLSEARGQPVDLAVGVMLGLPVGAPDALTRDNGLSVIPRVGLGRRYKDLFRYGAEVGGWLRPPLALSPDNAEASDRLGSQVDVGFGATTLGPKLRGELSLRGTFPSTRTPTSAELMAGLRYPAGPLEVYALGGPGFGRSPGTPAFRFLLGAAWATPEEKKPSGPVCVQGTAHEPADCPELDLDSDGLKNRDDLCPRVKGTLAAKGCADRDGDGVEDSVDRCPEEAGPAARKGCPAKDTDKDGVLDEDDACPKEPGPASAKGCPPKDTDHDGVTDDLDACPVEYGPVDKKGCPPRDTDGDGVTDDADACPAEVGPVDRKGCPPKDADKDGVLDEDDACPAEAGPVERKGCPPRDQDKDGVLDEADACPAEPGDAANAGCPIKDTDGDGVPDPVDNCRTEAGPADNQGCPKAKQQLVVITRDKFVIKEKVFFDTGKATIQKRSFGLLDQIASILKDHDEVKHVVVEGHTDDQGKADYNRTLSLARAASVKTYLEKQGVGAERLEAKGYGPDKPVGDNKTNKGREQNRRVEFVIVSGEKTETKTIDVK